MSLQRASSCSSFWRPDQVSRLSRWQFQRELANLYYSSFVLRCSTVLIPCFILDFEVTDPLPNITFDIGRSFAGNLPIQRGTNLSLFYWAIEHQNGSLTDEKSTAPWQIWLNGGPGSSSLLGLMFEVKSIHQS
jgi:hypothetical protein